MVLLFRRTRNNTRFCGFLRCFTIFTNVYEFNVSQVQKKLELKSRTALNRASEQEITAFLLSLLRVIFLPIYFNSVLLNIILVTFIIYIQLELWIIGRSLSVSDRLFSFYTYISHH